MLVDHGGRLWIGTSSGGLARYDGKIDGFTSYSTGPNGVSHSSASALADDGIGGIWIGTGGGLDHMDASGVLIQGGQGSGTLAAADLPQGGINALLLDCRGSLSVDASETQRGQRITTQNFDASKVCGTLRLEVHSPIAA